MKNKIFAVILSVFHIVLFVIALVIVEQAKKIPVVTQVEIAQVETEEVEIEEIETEEPVVEETTEEETIVEVYTEEATQEEIMQEETTPIEQQTLTLPDGTVVTLPCEFIYKGTRSFNYRSDGSKGNNVIARISNGNRVTITGIENEEWLKAQFAEKDGYVNMEIVYALILIQ